MALEGKIDFLKKTNPWGKAEDEEEDLMNKPPDPVGAANKLVAFVKRRMAQDAVKQTALDQRKARQAGG